MYGYEKEYSEQEEEALRQNIPIDNERGLAVGDDPVEKDRDDQRQSDCGREPVCSVVVGCCSSGSPRMVFNESWNVLEGPLAAGIPLISTSRGLRFLI